jgi:hypothetical protein
MEINTEQVGVFNNHVELGARLTLLLTVLDERRLDLDQLIFFDYVALYSSEFAGPDNIHPAVPNHIAEILYRRECLSNALNLFVTKGLISVTATPSGYFYKASKHAVHFAAALQSKYYKKLWGSLLWIDQNFEKLDNIRPSFLGNLGVKL